MKRRKSSIPCKNGPPQPSSLLRAQSLDLNSKSSSRSLHTSSRNKRQVLVRSKTSRSKHSLHCSNRETSIKEDFSSLESLFPLEKQFDLRVEDYLYLFPRIEENKKEDCSESSISDFEFGKPDEFLEKLKPVFPKLEAELEKTNEDDKRLNDEPTIASNLEKIESESTLPKIEEENLSNEKMSEHESEIESVHDEPEDNTAAVVTEDNSPDEDENAVQDNDPWTDARSQGATSKNSKHSKHDAGSIHALEQPLPPGIGEGIGPGPGQHCDSIMSSLPITESALIDEMRRDDQRARCISAEIRDLKKKIDAIESKSELTEEDGCVLRDLQSKVMELIGELNEITRKLQRTVGLCDPSSLTFAKMFDMLPYPHKQGLCDDYHEDNCSENVSCSNIDVAMNNCERFAFPQVDHPEDKIPRVIVCGNTEENIPKIAVADSRPKSRGNKCINDLTEKLSESLCMQEKLAKDNAQLENGKFRLEKELFEKDSAVENLQKKICSLQAEMRIVVKENAEFRSQLTCMAQQQQACSSPEPARSTARSTCPSPAKQQLDLSCKCKSRERAGGQPHSPAANACASMLGNPHSYREQQSCHSPRLRGGGSRGDGCGRGNNGCSKSSPNRAPRSAGGVCPAEMGEQIASFGNNTQHLSDQLNSLESQVNMLQSELACVKRERQQLDQQRKNLECSAPCTTCSPEPPKCPSFAATKSFQDTASCSPCAESPECTAQQLRDLREQYARLQDDYRSKMCEVSRLRADTDNLKKEARTAKEERERMEIKLIDAQERARAIEAERNDLLGVKEQLMEQEQALLVARQRFREAQDELEELRTMIRDQASQLDDYRNKYLMAQQQVEEQKRQMDLMEMDNARMNENVTLEIGRVKNQFQEKLAELAPLPDILKQTQVKLQETQQLRMLAEHNCEDLSRELLSAKDRIDTMQAQISDLQRELQSLQDENSNGGGKLEELERKNSELRTENERLKNAVNRFEEQQACVQKRLDEKQHEIAQLSSMLEQVREDSARQVARTKERCEAIKKSMQAQIGDFEIQLAQCRAAAKTAQKERDEIRQKMQGQIGNLNESLQQAQGRIRSLQGHVDYLKVSYSNVFTDPAPTMAPQTDSPLGAQGYDSCDCSY